MATKTKTFTKTEAAEIKTEAETETIQLKRSVFASTCYRRFDEPEEIAKIRRSGRKTTSDLFRGEYFYCKCKDKKTCVWYDNVTRVTRHSWPDQSCGITWAGVHGKDSICVVTRTGDLDLSRVHGFMIFSIVDEVFRNFRSTVISELEDLADPSSELRRMVDERIKRRNLGQCINTPFGVVSVAPLASKDHKASCVYEESKFTKAMVAGMIKEFDGSSSGDESEIDSDFDEDDEDACLKYKVKLSRRSWRNAPEIDTGLDEQPTIRFLKKEMENEELKRATALTIDKSVEERGISNEEKAIMFLEDSISTIDDFSLEVTVKTAISAFQRLFNKKFNANDIQVSVMDPDYFVLVTEDRFKDIYVKHLETVEIENYLSDIKVQEELMLSEHRPKKGRYYLRLR